MKSMQSAEVDELFEWQMGANGVLFPNLSSTYLPVSGV